MHPLDIISESPNLYILQKESNKSNFGGVLFLIYLAFIILVIVYYIIDYTQNPPYEIQSFSHFNLKTEQEKEERINNPLYNPSINFKLNLRDNKDGTNLSDKVKIYNPKTRKFINKNEIFKNDINGLTISGGDPLYKDNILTVTELCKEIKEKFPNKTIWVYTGSLYRDIKTLELMKYIDVIVDGEFKIKQKDITLAYRGSSNQRIIDVKSGKQLNY